MRRPEYDADQVGRDPCGPSVLSASRKRLTRVFDALSRDRLQRRRIIPDHRAHAAAQDQGFAVLRPSLLRVLVTPDAAIQRTQAGGDSSAGEAGLASGRTRY